MPTRAWELLAGSLIAIGCVPLPRGRLTREILAWAGLAMIGASILLFSPETTFPGYAAMLPVFGAAFLISAAEGTTAARLLGSLPAVAVGRISYSLYLWHWPIIVFGRRLDLIGSGWESILVACILSGLVAALSWKYVEQPFRGKAIGASKVFYFAGASAVVIFVASIALKASDGWPSRLPARVVAFDAASHDISPMRSACHTDHGLPDVGSSCIFGGKDASIAVWSDSHGVELSYALGTQYRPVMSITYSSCPPALGYNAVTRPDCPAHNRQVFQFLASSRSIDTVVLTAYYLGVGGPEFDADFSRTIRRLRASGKRVIVIGPFPSSGDDVPKALAHGRSRFFPKRSYEERYSKPISFLSTLQKDGVTVIWPDQFFCKGSECILSENGHPLFFDRHHPSMTGARFFVQQILEKRNDHILLSASGTP